MQHLLETAHRAMLDEVELRIGTKQGMQDAAAPEKSLPASYS